MTNHDVDLLILDAIRSGKTDFATIHAHVNARTGEDVEFRVVDRRLQAMKRRQIEFVRTPPLGWQLKDNGK